MTAFTEFGFSRISGVVISSGVGLNCEDSSQVPRVAPHDVPWYNAFPTAPPLRPILPVKAPSIAPAWPVISAFAHLSPPPNPHPRTAGPRVA